MAANRSSSLLQGISRAVSRLMGAFFRGSAKSVTHFGKRAAKAGSKVDLESYVDKLNFYKRVNKRGMSSWVDKITFKDVMTLWIFINVAFGFLFYFMSSEGGYIYSMREQRVIDSIEGCIYFSFISGTATGVGDGNLVPYGTFKIIVVAEVIVALLMLALITSKLVSIKQDVILDEIYELSFSEKVNKKRSTLMLFSQNVDAVIMKIEEGSIRKRELGSLYIHFSVLEDVLSETLALVKKPKGRSFVKKIDPVSTELILSSIVGGMDKISELLMIMSQHRIEWRTQTNLSLLKRCMNLTEALFSNLRWSDVRPEALSNLDDRRRTLVSRIKAEMERAGSWTYPDK